ARREPGPVHGGRGAGAPAGVAARVGRRPLRRAFLGARARCAARRQRAVAGRRARGRGGGAAPGRTAAAARPSPRPAPAGRPRLPSFDRPGGPGVATGSVRMTPGTKRRLGMFATTQIACSFVLLAGAGMLLATLNALQTATTGYAMRQVLAIDVPPPATGAPD